MGILAVGGKTAIPSNVLPLFDVRVAFMKDAEAEEENESDIQSDIYATLGITFGAMGFAGNGFGVLGLVFSILSFNKGDDRKLPLIAFIISTITTAIPFLL